MLRGSWDAALHLLQAYAVLQLNQILNFSERSMLKLSQEDSRFMKGEMCIDLDDLEAKIMHSLNPQQVNDACHLIERLCLHIRSGGVGAGVLSEFMKFSDSSNSGSSWYGVADPLRHAFTTFAHGGLHDLFIGQENDDWYPRIVLVDILEPNDIDLLPTVVQVYRGCDISELTSLCFGQSWTTCKETARKFAFEYYMDRPWFRASNRTVLEARIARRHIFFSQQSREFEVSLDSGQLVGVATVR